MYNFIKYGDNYSDTSGSLWQFKRDEQNMNNRNPANANTEDSISFKYESNLIKESTTVNINRVFENVKNSCSTKIF